MEVEEFEAARAHLRAVAYRLLGSLADAEDAVQQAWLKASRADTSDVRNPTGWLTTVTARECLDQLRARRRRAEVAVEPDALPTAATTEDEVVLAEQVGLALLVVLDRLSPAQRVAFVLHDLFALPFDDIARVLDRSPAATKKLASRARDRVHGQSPPDPHRAAHLPRGAAFLAASRGGDLPTLLDLLAPGVVRLADPVLLPPTIPTEVRGAAQVAEETRAFTTRARTAALAWLDGHPGLVVAPTGHLLAVLALTTAGNRITRIDVIGDPDRLAAITITLPHPARCTETSFPRLST